MSRGEFLGAGAMAAAGLGAGLIGHEAGNALPSPAQSPPQQVVCKVGTVACTPATLQPWSVPASVINIIWGDFWPRYIALWWTEDAPATDPPGSPLFGFGPISAAALEKAMQALIEAEAIPRSLPVPASSAAWTATRFQRRMKLALDYFQGTNPAPIPVSFVGEGGYDFVLSDVGLELFAPEEPEDDFEYLRYYAFRDTGRPSLGVPLYLKNASLALSLHAPTGPAQILSSNAALGRIRADAGGCTLSQLACYCPVSYRGGREGREVQFAFQSYLTATEAVRLWQLEGAVYRGILTELPRVIAEIWLERIHQATGNTTYDQRFRSSREVTPSAPAIPGVRQIFKERLETSLPEPPDMHWEVATVRDVTVSNEGLTFPAVPREPRIPTTPSRPGRPAGTGWDATHNVPNKDLILREIIAGYAGNPVFTDSRRPDGDE